MAEHIDTPCIGICSTIYGDDICRGCKRRYQEVIDWNTFDSGTKDDVFQRLWQNIVTVCQAHIKVTNAECLKQQCEKYNIRIYQQQPALCWAFYLLREGHGKIKDVSKYGITLTQPGQNLTTLYQQLDEALLTIS